MYSEHLLLVIGAEVLGNSSGRLPWAFNWKSSHSEVDTGLEAIYYLSGWLSSCAQMSLEKCI
jgi:hypothetical protein